MRIKTYTKRDIATKLGNKLGISTRKSLVYTDEMFNVIRELLCEEKPYIRTVSYTHLTLPTTPYV